MFCVYVLENKQNDELYTGFTTDLKRRLIEHNHKESKSTKRYGPWRCVYCEYCTEESDARRREKYLKTTQGRRMLRKRLFEYFKSKRRRAG